MSVHYLHEGESYYFARPIEESPLPTYGGHVIGWPGGVAPRPLYPLRIVARKDEKLPTSLASRVLDTEAEARTFVQRCRVSCVLLDARGLFAGGVFYNGSRTASRMFVRTKTRDSEEKP